MQKLKIPTLNKNKFRGGENKPVRAMQNLGPTATYLHANSALAIFLGQDWSCSEKRPKNGFR
jgi:hypothetical protein